MRWLPDLLYEHIHLTTTMQIEEVRAKLRAKRRAKAQSVIEGYASNFFLHFYASEGWRKKRATILHFFTHLPL
jgi:hypothetical protein